MSDRIISKPSTKEFRDGWDRVFGIEIQSDAFKAKATFSNNDEVKRFKRRAKQMGILSNA